MTLEQIIEMAKQAGISISEYTNTTFDCVNVDELQAFAQLVRNAALEEPVMWAWQRDDGSWYDASATHHSSGMKPLYASPPPPAEVPLFSDDEIEEICWTEVDHRLRSFARAIEQAVRQKADLK